MIFEVRNAADSVPGTYTPATANYLSPGVANARFKNITLIVKRLLGDVGNNAIGMFQAVH